ncbi:hypothetical protein DPX16_20610 [Anabarilius grahami]|uniref:Uncharacterized protein n=1 Tax=Anabarilius grahami TaxID=495550 RepID=A0A3N0YMJ9_ANAGA|nr:hypothetical protein DPX16_20610 [Anabarilius grahami]
MYFCHEEPWLAWGIGEQTLKGLGYSSSSSARAQREDGYRKLIPVQRVCVCRVCVCEPEVSGCGVDGLPPYIFPDVVLLKHWLSGVEQTRDERGDDSKIKRRTGRTHRCQGCACLPTLPVGVLQHPLLPTATVEKQAHERRSAIDTPPSRERAREGWMDGWIDGGMSKVAKAGVWHRTNTIHQPLYKQSRA